MNDLEATILKVKDLMEKSAVTNASYTFAPATRSIFNPENLDPIVKLLPPTATPVRSLLARSKGYGQASAWKMLTSQLAPAATYSGLTVSGTSTSGFFADGGTPYSTTQTFQVMTAAYKNIGRDVEVGRQAIASSRGYQDIRDQLVKIKMLEVMLAEEDAILNGSISADINSFDGLATTLTSNVVNVAGGYLTVSGVGSALRQAWNNWGAQPGVLVVTARQQQALADDLQGSGSIQRIVVADQAGATGGVRLASIVNPIDGTLISVVTSRYANTNGYLLSLADAAGQTWLEMEDLEGLSVYEPPVSTHSVISRVYETTVLKVIGEVKQIKLTGLATA